MMQIRNDQRLYLYSRATQEKIKDERLSRKCFCNKGCLCDIFLIACLILLLLSSIGIHYLRSRSTFSHTNESVNSTFDFQPKTSEPLSKEEIEIIQKRIPHDTQVSCKEFLIPSNDFRETEDISQIVPAEEKASRTYDDCNKIVSSWISIPESKFERSLPIAFSIMVYTEIHRFFRLLRAIYRASNVYCVHVDHKSSKDFQKNVSNIASCFPNVFIAKQPSILFGKGSILEKEKLCLKELWKQKAAWSWVINLNEDEFPLKTNLEIVHILNIIHDFNDIWVDPCTEYGYNSEWIGCRQSTLGRFKERWKSTSLPPSYVQPYKGQVHAVLTKAMVDYVLHNENAKAIYNWSLTTDFSHEIFFSTLNANAHLQAPGSNAAFAEHPLKKKPSLARLKLTKRHDADWPHCTFYLRDVCLLSPRELPLLTTSRQLFAHKFKPYHLPIGYACLEEWYFHKAIQELKEGRVQLDLRPYHAMYYQHLGI